jgi:anaerobic magnesium-protoporphyrin IX monomethyl ester cyclase
MYPPLGLLYLAAYIREKEDIELKVIDGSRIAYSALLSEVNSFSPDIIGISFTTQAATGAYRFINDIKDKRDIKTAPMIICGGPHPTAMPEDVLTRSNCDVVVIGEGELTFHEIHKMFIHGSYDVANVMGIAYSSGNEIKINPKRPLIRDLDTLPFPARDLIDLSVYSGLYYKKEKIETYMTSSRGCPYNCIYCSNPVWKNNKPWYRLRSPKNVVNEIEYIVNELGIREIYDQTDEFNGNMRWAKEVCDEIIKRGIKVSLKAQLRSDHVDRELAGKMKAAGFWLSLFGVESGNDKTLKGINKKVTTQNNTEALTILKEAGIKTFALLMAFNVWEEDGKLCFENKDDTNNTLAYARKLIKERKLDLMSWSLTTPYPGSQLYNIAVRNHLIPEDLVNRWELWDSSERMVMQLPGITIRDWVKIQNKGKRLQAYLLFKSGAFNFKSLPLYIKRGTSQMLKIFNAKN